jgi:hypothetical protein
MFWDAKWWKGDMYVRLSTNKCYNEDSNKLNKFWMSCPNIKQKRMQDYLDILEWHTFI